MEINQYDIWLANLNPSKGTEPGKVRPVVIVQTELLNNLHPSTIICPITSKVKPDLELLRVHLSENQLDQLSDILVDQIRAIDNQRLIRKIGTLDKQQINQLKENIKVVLSL